jgi:ubiquinol-cytochrome c reductase iron-sulfur subunit
MSDNDEKFDLENRIPDPGLHPHKLRASDKNPVAEKRAEQKVAIMFLLSAIGGLLFIWGYLGFTNNNSQIYIPILGNVQTGQTVMGFGLGLALLMIGMAMIQWARQLMPDEEVIAERHEFRSSDEDRADFVNTMKERAATVDIGRRKVIKRSMLAAFSILGLGAILPLRDLGDLPREQLNSTDWKAGTRLMTDPGKNPIRPEDLEVGSVVQVMPELPSEATLEQVARDPVLLIRLNPADFNLDAERLSWTYNGIIAFSKICSHMGCAVALYEQQTHHLLCPCHQSTFDVTRAGKVIFGPAARPLPQLPITVNSAGYLVAVSDFHEPIGPSFWERNSNKKI